MDKQIEKLPSDPDNASPGGGSLHRLIVLCAVLMLAMLLVYLLPVRNWLRGPALQQHVLASLGNWVYPVGIIAVALLVGCGVPRLLLCGLAGAVLGFWWGLLVANAGSLLGYYLIFLFTRWGGRDWALRRWPALQKWASLLHDHGIMGVILLRQLPIHGTFINLGLGLSHVKQRHFLIGTTIGSLPEAIPMTLAGAGLVSGSLKSSAGYVSLAVAGLAVVWIGCGYMIRAIRNSRSELVSIAEAAGLKGTAE